MKKSKLRHIIQEIIHEQQPLNIDDPKSINPEITPTDKKLAGPDKNKEPDKKPG